MRVLVTGAAGMLGSALIRAFSRSSDFEIRGITRSDLDLRDAEAFARAVEDFQPDLIVHAAAKVGGIRANIANPVGFLASNLQMDTAVILTAMNLGVGNLVYVGSSCMYPKDYRQPLLETDILAAPLEATNEGYALAKITGSKLCEYASRSHGLNYRTIIPSNLYGPGDNFQANSSHLVASVIRKVHEAKLTRSETIDVWGRGTVRREFTYIDDLSAWLGESVSNLGSFPHRLNVGFGRDYSVDEYYQAALDVLGVNAELIHSSDDPEGMQVKLMDSSVARMSFGWRPQTDIHEGIERTYKWFLENESLERI